MKCGAFPRARRCALVLEGSKVRSVRLDAGTARLALSALLHVAQGEASTAWEQELELVVEAAALVEAPAALVEAPAALVEAPAAEGALWIEEARLLVDGALRAPELALDERGDVRLELAGAEGRLVVTGQALRSEERGAPRFLERL